MDKIFPLLFIMYICSQLNTWEQGDNSTEVYVIHSIFESSYANSINLFLITKCKIFIVYIVFLLEKLGKGACYHLQISIWSYMELIPWPSVCRFHDNYHGNLFIGQLI